MKIKRNLVYVFLAILLSFVFLNTSVSANNSQVVKKQTTNLHIFYGKGCSHCGKALDFLRMMENKYPGLKVTEHEVYFDTQERNLFAQMSEKFGTKIEGVPTIFTNDKVFVGFSNTTAESVEQEIEQCLVYGCNDTIKKAIETTKTVNTNFSVEEIDKTKLKKTLTIPAVISAATVDAINPCAFAVLIILLTTILASKNKRRALLSGLAFSSSIFISYLLMGIGLYSAIQATGLSHNFYGVVAVLAILIGLFNLKDYLWYGKWFVMEVPMSWRPRLKAILRGVTSVPGAFLIGFVISLFLLPCTSGPYIVILGLLAKSATKNYAFLLLILYNLIFVLPMIVITLAIYFGFTTTEQAEVWRTKRIKLLHLIAGIIILCLGIGMLIAMKLGMI
jgi:cytochrome c biogenesis protein CcdA